LRKLQSNLILFFTGSAPSLLDHFAGTIHELTSCMLSPGLLMCDEGVQEMTFAFDLGGAVACE